MTLVEFSKQRFNPTDDQLLAFSMLDKFLHSNEKCFLLKGYAGTGKTTLTKTISEYMESQKLSIQLMAPTGRAARILNEKTGIKATTIHKGIYDLNCLDEVEIKIENKIQYKFRFRLVTSVLSQPSLLIIDEASMISDKYAEADFFIFGSGILLKDVLNFFAPLNKAIGTKILIIGDPAQLPPVTDPFSAALSADYLLKNYQLPITGFELTQVVRQDSNNGIFKLATYLRDRLVNKHLPFKIDFSSPDVHPLKPEEAADLYKALNPDIQINHTIIINYSNKSALEYNLLIREKYFHQKFQITRDDILIIQQNNYHYDIELYNGLMVKVTWVNPTPQVRSNILSYDRNGKECRINFKFRKIRIAWMGQSELVNLDCLILEDFLYSPNARLTYEEHIALYLDFKIRHPQLKPGTEEFTSTIKQDPFFNALKVKYGYAITCHKAQGGEWDSVIVNMDIALGRHSAIFTRWMYTAVTRARKAIYIFNYKATTAYAKLKFEPVLILESDIPQQLKIISRPTVSWQELLEQFHLENEPYFKKEKFKDVYARAHYFGYKIMDHKSYNYQEQYSLEKEGSTVTLIFWYNQKNTFTKITIQKASPANVAMEKDAVMHFEQPADIVFKEDGDNDMQEIISIEATQEKMSFLFPDENTHLSKFYNDLNEIILRQEITISGLEHGQYFELYTFMRNQEQAVIQFYYNDKREFTQARNLINKCNSNKLLLDLKNCVEELKKYE